MKPITPPQTARFWVVFSEAARNLGLTTKNDREVYRKMVLVKEGGVQHLRDLDRTSGYDRVMARLSMDAGNYADAVHYVESTTYRLACVLEVKSRAAAGDDWEAYLKGICTQSGIGSGRALEDMTEPELRALIAIIDTHLRRLKRQSKVS